MKKILLSLVSLLYLTQMSAQIDSLVLINGDVIIGEVKEMRRSVVIIETDYSDSDFKIEWEGIEEIYTERHFIILLTNGRRITGRLRTIAPGMVHVSGDEADEDLYQNDIVFLDKYGSSFLSNFYADIGIGLNLTKANNFSQFTINASTGYLAKKWSVDLTFDDLKSVQDNVEQISRTEIRSGFRYFLPKKWYLAAAYNMLTNTEQALKLRTTGMLGTGYFISRNNKLYWNVGIGASANFENFFNETPDRESIEAYFGSEINLFNITDFSLVSNIFAFPSITESGRWRVDYMINTKYDLPLDFYIGLNFTLNYDNRPAEVGREFDYVFGASFGWDW